MSELKNACNRAADRAVLTAQNACKYENHRISLRRCTRAASSSRSISSFGPAIGADTSEQPRTIAPPSWTWFDMGQNLGVFGSLPTTHGKDLSQACVQAEPQKLTT